MTQKKSLKVKNFEKLHILIKYSWSLKKYIVGLICSMQSQWKKKSNAKLPSITTNLVIENIKVDLNEFQQITNCS